MENPRRSASRQAELALPAARPDVLRGRRRSAGPEFATAQGAPRAQHGEQDGQVLFLLKHVHAREGLLVALYQGCQVNRYATKREFPAECRVNGALTKDHRNRGLFEQPFPCPTCLAEDVEIMIDGYNAWLLHSCEAHGLDGQTGEAVSATFFAGREEKKAAAAPPTPAPCSFCPRTYTTSNIFSTHFPIWWCAMRYRLSTSMNECLSIHEYIKTPQKWSSMDVKGSNAPHQTPFQEVPRCDAKVLIRLASFSAPSRGTAL